MNYSEAFGGGDGGAILDYALINTSQLYTVPYDGLLDLLALAGAGSGALGRDYVTGPGAGEIGISRAVRVYKDDVLIVTVGLGGSPSVLTAGLGTTGIAGNAGADTSITSSRGWSVIVKGGQGGKVGPRGTQLTGALGGRGGSGAQIHIPGGNGGSILTTYSQAFVTGGGAPNFRNLGADSVRGGNITASASTLNPTTTGGGGVGGHGGDISINSLSSTCGGGYGGPGANDVNAGGGPNALGKLVIASPALQVPGLAVWGLDIFGGGGQSASSPSGPGAGSGSRASAGAGMQDTAPNLDSFGGCGAASAVASSASLVLANAPIGCTGASACASASAGYTVTSGRGGQGIAVLILRKG